MSRTDRHVTIKLPADVERLLRVLTEAGFEAYVAGGSVRDLLLKRKPKDYDIATSARPEQIEKLFPKTIAVGREFGILIVQSGRNHYEVATFRGERGFSDQRRPDEVYWTTAEEDALRRDFTVNSLFYDARAQLVIDYTTGLLDLENQILRFVGDPATRIQEDHLRILRAVRLKNALNFQYDPGTYRAVRQFAGEVSTVSGERIRHELDRIWADPRRSHGLRELADVGLLSVVLPEVDQLRGLPQPKRYHREGDTFDHTVRAVATLPVDAPSFLVWAVLLHDVGKYQTLHYPDAPGDRLRFDGHAQAGAALVRQIGVRLHMSRTEMDTIAWLVEHHMHLVGLDTMREAKRREYLLDPRFRWLLELHHADAAGTVPRDLTLYNEVKSFYTHYLQRWQREQASGAPQPLVSGHDLQKALKLSAGKEIGQLLAEIRAAQLEGTVRTKTEALRLAKKLIST